MPPASEEEEDLLDIAASATRTSRLACQILITEEHQEPQRPDPARLAQLDGPLAVYGHRIADLVSRGSLVNFARF